MKKHLSVIVILTLSLATHFIFFGYPNETVFDEVHFGKFISGYFTHEYFFDIHPPLGKLLLSGAGYMTGFKPGFSFANIGEQFPDNKYLWLRLLPTLAGTLLPLVVYLLALRLGLSRLTSITVGILMALESSFIVQSRFILLDSFLLLFGFSALLSYFQYRVNKKKMVWLVLAGVTASLSVSVKWTGLSFLGIIGLIELFDFVQKPNLKASGRIITNLVAIPIIIYCSIFVIHLELLTKSGPGNAFMTPQFQKTLAGSPDANNSTVQPLNMWRKVVELNEEMYRSNATLTATHPYSSKWYTWPFMKRPIYYWYKDVTPTMGQNFPKLEARIYFLGNPVIWLLSTLAIFYLLLDQLVSLAVRSKTRIGRRLRSDKGEHSRRKLEFLPLFIAGGYVVNLLPFVGIPRAMFLYHYMIGYIFAILALGYLLDKVNRHHLKFVDKFIHRLNINLVRISRKRLLAAMVILVSFLTFVFFAPLTYGLPLTEKDYNLRVWFSSWL